MAFVQYVFSGQGVHGGKPLSDMKPSAHSAVESETTATYTQPLQQAGRRRRTGSTRYHLVARAIYNLPIHAVKLLTGLNGVHTCNLIMACVDFWRYILYIIFPQQCALNCLKLNSGKFERNWHFAARNIFCFVASCSA